MKKIFCICNTYYQLIFALQLRKTVYADDFFVLLLSNHSNDSEKIYAGLKSINCFNEICYVESKDIDYTQSLNPFDGVSYVVKKIENLSIDIVDELLIYNISKFSSLVLSVLYKQNPKLVIHRFEEGVLSYNTVSHKQIPLTKFLHINQALYHFRVCFQRYDLLSKVNSFYCFFPAIYQGKLSTKQVPLIKNDEETPKLITTIFNIKQCKQRYCEKYIYFTSVYDFEGGESIRELELVRKVADVVGKENLLIKMHPRDTRTIYEDEGFHIDTNSSVPFEALLFAYDFSDKILLTATSGAVLSASLMHENPPETYYMYPLCKLDGNPTAKKTIEQIDDVLCHDTLRDQLKKIYVCNDVRDIIR